MLKNLAKVINIDIGCFNNVLELRFMHYLKKNLYLFGKILKNVECDLNVTHER